jgi:hypothetical protein
MGSLTSHKCSHAAIENPKKPSPYFRWLQTEEGRLFWAAVDLELYGMVHRKQTTELGASYVRNSLKRLHARSFGELKRMSDADLMLLGGLGKKTLAALRALCEAGA